LAVATVPVDGLRAERWDDLAVTVLVADGDDLTAWEVLAAHEDRYRRRGVWLLGKSLRPEKTVHRPVSS